MTDRFHERLCDGYGQWFDVERIVHESHSEHQHLVIFENPAFGRVMALDGIVQTTERDEFIYHEMLAHVPLFAHGDARRVLIVGGGDGGTLREVLRHPGVEAVTICEIDADVIETCRRFLPGHSAGAFDDPRARVVIGDGLRHVATTADSYDAILCDSTDPVGPGAALFTPAFYAGCRRCLRDSGVFAGHAGVAWFQTADAVALHAHLGDAFGHVGLYGAAVPTYAGGVMSFALAAGARAVHETGLALLRERFAAQPIGTAYYTPELHAGAFAMPRFLIDAIESGAPPPGPQWRPDPQGPPD